MVLPDVLKPNLKIVFCGTAVSKSSAGRNSYYAGKGNLFYKILSKSKLTPFVLNPEDYKKLLFYEIGLTDLAKNTSGNDSDLNPDDFDVKGFYSKILNNNPQWICFNGKEAARVYFNLKSTKEISYGIRKEQLGNTKIFIAPSTSSQARKYWDESYWLQLKTLLDNETI